jgi:hypothetical protein
MLGGEGSGTGDGAVTRALNWGIERIVWSVCGGARETKGAGGGLLSLSLDRPVSFLKKELKPNEPLRVG